MSKAYCCDTCEMVCVYLGVQSHIAVTVCTRNLTQNNSGGAVKVTKQRDKEILMRVWLGNTQEIRHMEKRD